MNDEVKAIANAVEATAKTAGKSVDAIRQFGGFISEFTRVPLQAGLGILGDKLVYMRWERQQRLLVRAQHFLSEAGLTHPTRAVPLQFAVPLLEGASLEEDDRLQDLWAKLLVNAANADSTIERRRSFISILEQLTALDALILLKIYSLFNSDTEDRAAITTYLPAEARLWQDGDSRDRLEHPSPDVMLSLANLVRIGCLDAEEEWSGKKDYRHAYRNVLGTAFVHSVTLHRQPEE